MQKAIVAICTTPPCHQQMSHYRTSINVALKERIPGANSVQNLETGKQTNSESKRLFSSLYDILKPIFSRLSSKALLEKCLKVVTQNANESLNLVIPTARSGLNLQWQSCLLLQQWCWFKGIYSKSSRYGGNWTALTTCLAQRTPPSPSFSISKNNEKRSELAN